MFKKKTYLCTQIGVCLIREQYEEILHRDIRLPDERSR